MREENEKKRKQEKAKAASLVRYLHNKTAATLGNGLLVHACSDGLVEDGLEALLSQSRALVIGHGADLLGTRVSLLDADNAETLGSQSLDHAFVAAQIGLGADQDDGHAGSVVLDLGPPLGLDVVERAGRDDGEADQEDISLGVGQGAQAVIVLLTGGIPKTKVDRLAIDHDVGRVVVEDGRNVLSRKGICGVGDQEASLACNTKQKPRQKRRERK